MPKKINKNRKLEEKRKKKKKESRIKIGQKLGKNENRFYNQQIQKKWLQNIEGHEYFDDSSYHSMWIRTYV